MNERVLHLSNSDIGHGAGRAAYRLHAALRQVGAESSMLVGRKLSADPTVTVPDRRLSLPERLVRYLRRLQIDRRMRPYRAGAGGRGIEFITVRSRHRWEWARQLPPHQLLNLHSLVDDFLDQPALFRHLGNRRTPVVWTLHDMHPYTGGCYYTGPCHRFADACGCCPELASEAQNDLSAQEWRTKATMYSGLTSDQLCLVSPSRWNAAQCAASSLLGRFEMRVIPNSVSTETFCPRPMQSLRQALGIPQDARVVLFVAHSLRIRRKGMDLLLAALQALGARVPGLFLLSVGGAAPGNSALTLTARHLGQVPDEGLLAAIYNTADVVVIPSREDNLPNVALEAFASGVPVVAFGAGGLPELVRPGKTGFLVPAEDSAALAKTLADAIQHPDLLADMSATCRAVAVQEYSPEVQSRAYLSLYRELLGPSPFLSLQGPQAREGT